MTVTEPRDSIPCVDEEDTWYELLIVRDIDRVEKANNNFFFFEGIGVCVLQ